MKDRSPYTASFGAARKGIHGQTPPSLQMILFHEEDSITSLILYEIEVPRIDKYRNGIVE
jgi:hypothetical protein